MLLKLKRSLNLTGQLSASEQMKNRFVRISEALRDEPLKLGDSVLLNHTSGMLLEKTAKTRA